MLQKLWIELRSSLWFVPVVLVCTAVALALGLIELDVAYAEPLATAAWRPLLNAGAEGARGMLTAIAGSMITVAGVAFSITIVTLSLASTQYTPRILRNFMRDRANQFVLGTFVSIFTYCLIVLRTIRGGNEADAGGFVPLLATAVGMLLALLSIFCLIFFIHHVAASIQASSILQAISQETFTAIDSLFPTEIGEGGEIEPALDLARDDGPWHALPAQASGYVQHVASEELLAFAKKHDLVVRIERHPGDFAIEATPLASTSRPLDEDTLGALRPLFVIGDFRTVEQDAGFGIRQIVDIAMKALSPGVNDASTAVSCLDYLAAILARLATRRLASPAREDEGELRIIAPARTFADFVARCFDEIRLCASGNVTILRAILEVIARIAPIARDSSRRAALARHAALVRTTADRTIPLPYDREIINDALALVRSALADEGATLGPLPAERRE